MIVSLQFQAPERLLALRLRTETGLAWLCARDLATCLGIASTDVFERFCHPSPKETCRMPLAGRSQPMVWLAPGAVLRGLKGRSLRTRETARALKTWLEREVLPKLDLDQERERSQLRSIELAHDLPETHPEYRKARLSLAVPEDLVRVWREVQSADRSRVQAAFVDAVQRMSLEGRAQRKALGLVEA